MDLWLDESSKVHPKFMTRTRKNEEKKMTYMKKGKQVQFKLILYQAIHKLNNCYR